MKNSKGIDLNKYDKIRVFHNVHELTGMGEEWLCTPNGDVLMIFIDGWFQTRPTPMGNMEATLPHGISVA